MNLEALSDADLEALAEGDMTRLSDAALAVLSGESDNVNLAFNEEGWPSLTDQSPTYERPVERSAGERALGALDAAATAATAATGGLFGQVQGGVTEAIDQMRRGTFGTPQGADEIQQAAMEQASEYTWQPRTEAGQEYLEELEPVIGQLPPILGVANPGAIAPTVRAGAAGVRDVPTLARPATPAPAPSRAPPPVRMPAPGTVFADDSVGAARTPTETYRQIMAEQLPIPLRGESAPTAGQRSRDFAQLQFEQETAKAGDLGAPLRSRYLNQADVLRRNLDYLLEEFDPREVEPVGIGYEVDTALRQRQANLKRRTNRAYERARTRGEMEAPEPIAELPGVLDEMVNMEGVAPNVRAIRNEAQRLGLLAEDENGNLVATPQPIDTIESLRQFVNEATDFTVPRESRVAGKVVNAIDNAMEDKGGPAYQIARGLARRQFEEFKDTKIVADVLGSKGRTSERRIAIEDVADRIVVRAPVEEMVKARNVMRRAGEEGDQAWRDLQAFGIQHIMDRAYGTQRDAAGQPVIVPSQFIKAVNQFDRSGKLEILYGKKNAQVLRDVAELSRLLLTAPPGAVNYSNTASALRNILSDMAMSGGDPQTASIRRGVAALKNMVANRRLQKDIDRALRGELRKGR